MVWHGMLFRWYAAYNNITGYTFGRTLKSTLYTLDACQYIARAVNPGRDAPYLTSDVPPVWKHGYTLPPPHPHPRSRPRPYSRPLLSSFLFIYVFPRFFLTTNF